MLLGKYSEEHSPLDCIQTLLIWHSVADTFWAGSGSRCWALENLAFCDLPKVTAEVSGRDEKQTQILKQFDPGY